MTYACVEQPMQTLDDLHLGAPAPRIGVFGGTFNPVHNGHLDIALHARAEFDLLHVLFVVAGDPPHKGDDIAPRQMRMDMVELATLNLPALRPSDIELYKETPAYTVETMQTLRKKYPEKDFFFIIGEDSLYQLDSWHNIRELCQMVEFICVRRMSDELRNAEDEIRNLSEKYDAVIHLSDYTGPPISSTRIRELVHEGKSIKGLVPPSVEEYIYATGLYK